MFFPQPADDILDATTNHAWIYRLRSLVLFIVLCLSCAYLSQAVAQTSTTCPSVTVGEQSGLLISPSLYSGCYYSVNVQHRAKQKTPIIEYGSLVSRYYGASAEGSVATLYNGFTPSIAIGSRQLVEHITTNSSFSQVPMIVNMGLTEPSGCANADYTAAAENVIKVTGDWYCAKEASVSAVSIYYKWQAGSVVPFESSEISYVETGGAGISVSTASVSVAEGSTAATLSPTAATFTIVLDSEPTAGVTIGLSSSNANKGIVSPSSLTFTSSNWNMPQTGTITSVDDAVADGDYHFSIVTASAISTDSFYNDLNSSDVLVTTIDDDNVGITVGGISGDTTEAGGTATFTVKLDSEPTAQVSIALNSSDTGEGVVSPALLTFTPSNWSGVQTVTVTGVDDEAADGSQRFDIVTTATSTDGGYNGWDVADVPVTNLDNDSADAIEASVPNVTGAGFGDGNGDGTVDSDQDYVTSLKSNDGSHWLTFANTANASQSNFSTAAAPTTLPADHQLTLGTVQFDLASSSGAAVSIEVYVDQDTAISDYLLLGNDGEWHAQNAAVTHIGNKTKLVFSVTEGGNFDRNAADDSILPDGTLQLAPGGVMVKTGFVVYPHAYLFGDVDLTTQTAAKTFTLSNTGSRVLTLSTVTSVGNNAAEFIIDSDSCTGQTLDAGEACQVAVRFQPASIGSKAAQLSIQTDDPDNVKVNIFLRNHEADEEESARRLPPVLNTFSIEDAGGQLVSTMQVGTSYTIKWSILGYHEDYTSLLAIFDCRGIADNTTCGDTYSGTKFLATGSINDDGAPVDGHWRNGSIQSKVFSFSHTFTAPALTEEAPVVIRFYRKNNDDQQVGNRSLSLIIPGNQADDYYDTTGRRVKNVISLP